MMVSRVICHVSTCPRAECQDTQACQRAMAPRQWELPVVAHMHFTKDGNIRAWSGNINDQTLAAVTEAIGRAPTAVCDHATATQKLEELRREVEGLRVKAQRYDFLAKQVRTDGSGGKFNLPMWGVLEFTWHRFAWEGGKPVVIMELDAAIDSARSQSGGGVK